MGDEVVMANRLAGLVFGTGFSEPVLQVKD